jgi:hypothetical protein
MIKSIIVHDIPMSRIAAPYYTKPSWVRYDKYPFLKPFVDFVCSFILERPNDEFLRDARGYL